MGQAAEIADHHAKAVIERHRNAYPVVLRELHRAGDEETVVQDIVVAERGALREASRAAGELDVDRVVELQFVGERRETVPLGIAGRPETSSNRTMPWASSLPIVITSRSSGNRDGV